MKKLILSFIVLFTFFMGAAIAEETGDITTSLEEIPVRYGITNTKGVNVRGEADAKAKIIEKLPIKGSPFVILEDVDASGTPWYKVDLGSEQGYIRGDLVDEIDKIPNEGKYTEIETAWAAKSVETASRGVNSGNNTSLKEAPKKTGGSVWIPTKGGSKYHSSKNCSNMNGPHSVSLSEAQRLKYTPCKKCY